MRVPISVRQATPDDAAALVNLWRANAAQAPGGHGAPMWREPAVEEAHDAIALTISNPERKLLVAVAAEEVVGVVSILMRTLTPIHLTRSLIITDLEVLPQWRRRAVASALMAAACDWADELDSDVIVTISGVQQRESGRFLAKLGFTQVSVARAVQTSILRSRLSSKATQSRDTGKMIALRSTLRRRQLRSISRPPAD